MLRIVPRTTRFFQVNWFVCVCFLCTFVLCIHVRVIICVFVYVCINVFQCLCACMSVSSSLYNHRLVNWLYPRYFHVLAEKEFLCKGLTSLSTLEFLPSNFPRSSAFSASSRYAEPLPLFPPLSRFTRITALIQLILPLSGLITNLTHAQNTNVHEPLNTQISHSKLDVKISTMKKRMVLAPGETSIFSTVCLVNN